MYYYIDFEKLNISKNEFMKVFDFNKKYDNVVFNNPPYVCNIDNTINTFTYINKLDYNKHSLNTYLIDLSYITSLNIDIFLDIIKENKNTLYFDFYIDCYIDKHIDKKLKFILEKLSYYDIRICYTFDNIINKVKYRKIYDYFKDYGNYFDIQDMIVRDSKNLCVPKAIKVSNKGSSLICKNDYLETTNENLIKLLDISLNCSEKCNIGDAVNKKLNYDFFYKKLF